MPNVARLAEIERELYAIARAEPDPEWAKLIRYAADCVGPATLGPVRRVVNVPEPEGPWKDG